MNDFWGALVFALAIGLPLVALITLVRTWTPSEVIVLVCIPLVACVLALLWLWLGPPDLRPWRCC